MVKLLSSWRHFENSNASPIPAHGRPEGQRLAGGRRRRLMIVDDDPAICALVRATAEAMDFEVGTTLTGREFKRCYPDFAPDMVLVDLMLPDQDGTELLRFLARAEATATIWIISAHYRNIRRLAVKLGAAYGLAMAGDLAKPVGAADLQAALTADTLDLDDIDAKAS